MARVMASRGVGRYGEDRTPVEEDRGVVSKLSDMVAWGDEDGDGPV